MAQTHTHTHTPPRPDPREGMSASHRVQRVRLFGSPDIVSILWYHHHLPWWLRIDDDVVPAATPTQMAAEKYFRWRDTGAAFCFRWMINDDDDAVDDVNISNRLDEPKGRKKWERRTWTWFYRPTPRIDLQFCAAHCMINKMHWRGKMIKVNSNERNNSGNSIINKIANAHAPSASLSSGLSTLILSILFERIIDDVLSFGKNNFSSV